MLNSSFRLDVGRPNVLYLFACCQSGLGMTSTLKSAAQELRELYGADADRICLRSAENDGMPDKAELAAEAVRLCLPK